MSDWREQAGCKGHTRLMFDLAHSTTAELMCDRCPVRGECDDEAHAVRPVAGRWAGRVYEGGGHNLGIKGRVQWRVYDALTTHGPIVDEDGKALVALAKLARSSTNSTSTACRRLQRMGLVEYEADQQGTYWIGAADKAEGAA